MLFHYWRNIFCSFFLHSTLILMSQSKSRMRGLMLEKRHKRDRKYARVMMILWNVNFLLNFSLKKKKSWRWTLHNGLWFAQFLFYIFTHDSSISCSFRSFVRLHVHYNSHKSINSANTHSSEKMMIFMCTSLGMVLKLNCVRCNRTIILTLSTSFNDTLQA